MGSKMKKVGHLTDYIITTEPLLTKETLKEILEVANGIEWRIPEKRGELTRTCMTFPLSMAVTGAFPVPEGRLDRIKKADEILLKATYKALDVYKKKYSFYITTDSGFDILRYEEGQLIDYHIDDSEPRVLSMSIALNDDYAGGEFRFWKNDNVKFRISSGCAIMFPPNFMYPHEILPVTSGIRYSMITWFK
jgi:hypothetical protein